MILRTHEKSLSIWARGSANHMPCANEDGEQTLKPSFTMSFWIDMDY